MVGWRCAHGALHEDAIVTRPQAYDAHHDEQVLSSNESAAPPWPGQQNRSAYRPMRIHTQFGDLSSLNTSTRLFVTETLLPAAVEWLQHALRVVPVFGLLNLGAGVCHGELRPLSVAADVAFIVTAEPTGVQRSAQADLGKGRARS